MWTVFLALRYFCTRRKESMISFIGLISVFGIALGVGALVVVLSVMNGFNEQVRDKIIGTYSHIIATSLSPGMPPRPEGLEEVLRENEKITDWAPFITGQAILQGDDFGKGVMVKAIDPVREAKVTDLGIRYSADEVLEPGKIILGSAVKEASFIFPSGVVEILAPHSARDISRKELKIAGTFSTGRYDYDSNLVLMHLEDAQELFRMDGSVTGIGMKIDDAMEAVSVKNSLIKAIPFGYNFRSWMELDENLVTALALEKKMMFIILTVIIMVACFNIASSLIMMVMEKTRDIGVLKSLGASDSAISFMFLLEAALSGIVGVLLGTVAGYYVARNVNEFLAFIENVTGLELFPSEIYYFTELPVRVLPSDLAQVAVVAMVLTLLAGLYPARRASKLEPVEAIRYE